MEVDVWSRHAASTRPLVVAGAAAHDAVSETVKNADVVISMLPHCPDHDECHGWRECASSDATRLHVGSDGHHRSGSDRTVGNRDAEQATGCHLRRRARVRQPRPRREWTTPHSGVRPTPGREFARTGLRGVGASHALARSRRSRQPDEARLEHMVGVPGRGRCRGGRTRGAPGTCPPPDSKMPFVATRLLRRMP